ncbi:MAG: site-specific integrase [Nitrosopumilaceae archaeon]|nr:site-specific integrase [Nitrosopumilaceae archaeon]
MLDAADIRTKCIILVCASSGIRVGAFEGLSWGDMTPLYKDTKKQELVAIKIIVYKNTNEQYITFLTPECYSILLQYKNLRESVGEKITSKSPLIRNSWDNHRYRKNQTKNPKDVKYLTPKTIANLMGEFLKRINLRDSSGEYEFKQIHGFRKYFKTNAERTIKTIDVEKLMGHAENYYKPSEDYLLEQYSKGISDLTISEASDLKNRLEKQVIISDKKVGEIERDNVLLQDRLAKLESSYGSLKEILEDVLLARTK